MFLIIKKKHIIAAAAGLLALIMIPVGIRCFAGGGTAAAAKANTDWGLSFQEEGKTPVGNATADFLKQYDSYYVGNPSEKKIYLTFDAGFERPRFWTL